MSNQPFVSIIIPVNNGRKHIERCLEALIASSYPSFEIIVVDDCSTDESVAIARRKGVKVIQLSNQSGPATARNIGAKNASGEIFLFIDSDVVVRRETISSVVADFQQNPDISAVFGSYDDDPAEGNFISQYRNLFHHFHHQHSDTEAFTFWAGCGAIRKKVFEEIGGFDQKKYTKPSIEDIELGYRIRKKGYQIYLDKGMQVKHLKRWEFLSMLKTDIFQRAIPWSRLIIETKFMPKSLNLQMSHKVSSISVAMIILVIALLLYGHEKFYNIPLIFISGLLSLAIFILNRKLYGFYAWRRGLYFMALVVPLHLLYYVYSGMSFGFSWSSSKIPHLCTIYIVQATNLVLELTKSLIKQINYSIKTVNTADN